MTSSAEDPYGLVEALVAAQRWESARAEASAGLARSPADPRLLALLLRSLRATGRRDEAIEAARQLLTAAPQDPYSYRLGTLALLDVGWVDEAIGLAGRAVALDPSSSANHLALARAWAQSPRPESIARQLAASREAVLLDPNSADAQVQIGVALAADADPEGARAAYMEALRLDPRNAAALNNLAVLELQAGAPDEAVRHLAAALAADPQGSIARRNLDAVALRVIGRLGWWMLLAPIPGLLASAAGAHGLAMVLSAGALLGLPAVVARWWRALTPGQRIHLRTVHRRVRRRSWTWPLTCGLVGAAGLVGSWLGADAIHLAAYAVVAGYLAMLRLVAAVARRGWRRTVAAWRARLGSAPRGRTGSVGRGRTPR